MALRELIKDAHDSAENHPFVKKLFAGQITKEEYGDFLFNQKHCYATLEQRAEDLGLLDDILNIKRTTKIAQDLRDLNRDKSRQHLHMSTMAYCEYVKTCSKEQLLAHIYVRHFGDMYGGQIDMDAMYNMMKGGTMYQQGGQQQDPVMQAIQMYAQMTEMDPEQLMQQLQALPPLEQQEAIQKIMQAIQEAQTGQMKNGGIYINPANKGKFTESANRAGMGVQEFARKVLANKEDYSATQVKRANFARNAAGWKKQFGGMTQGSELELHPDEIQALIDQGYGIEYLD